MYVCMYAPYIHSFIRDNVPFLVSVSAVPLLSFKRDNVRTISSSSKCSAAPFIKKDNDRSPDALQCTLNRSNRGRHVTSSTFFSPDLVAPRADAVHLTQLQYCLFRSRSFF